MTFTRRAFTTFLLATPFAAPLSAQAQDLTTDAARAFVAAMVRDLEAIVKSASAGDNRADAFLALFRRVAALPEIGRFTIGVAWRSMTDAQKAAYLAAFEGYASRAYSRGLGEYAGQTIVVAGAQDVGRRGVQVNSLVKRPGAADVRLDWLVSDRSGVTQLSDVSAEGVSLSILQRETFAAMLEKRGGDVDRFIADLDRMTPGA